MKKIIVISFLFMSLFVNAQDKKEELKSQIVEVSCGECKFGMKGKSCNLAVRIDGKSYFVDGTNINQHGDAHAKDGFCKAIRKAKVVGEIVNNRFVVSSFELIPEKEKKTN
jgi:Family of unknown function (DUF6370)